MELGGAKRRGGAGFNVAEIRVKKVLRKKTTCETKILQVQVYFQQ